jgi:hypothetical protein
VRGGLRYIEHDPDRRPSTVRDYRNIVSRYLLPQFGADASLERISTEDVDAYREALLDEGRLSRRTIQKILVLLHGILKRAKRKKWIASNPAEDAERITLKRSGDFNVLSPSEIEALVRAAADEQDAADTGEAQIAETVLGGRRLIVRRTRLVGVQAELFPDWRHFPFATNRSEPIALVEAEHRQHAVVERVIRHPATTRSHTPPASFTPTARGP